MTPEENFKNLPGRIIGIFVISIGGFIFGMDYFWGIWFERYIVGGKSIVSALLIIGIATLLLTPQEIKIKDFMENQVGFYKKVWILSNGLFRVFWVITVGCLILTFAYFLINLGG